MINKKKTSNTPRSRTRSKCETKKKNSKYKFLLLKWMTS